MSDDINYHFPDFLLANQSKNVFAKHAVDLANKYMSLETLPIRIIEIMRIDKFVYLLLLVFFSTSLVVRLSN